MDSKLLYLVQTDTTVGFSSLDDERLNVIKNRDKNQKILKTLDSFTSLKEFTRVPKKYRKMVRNSSKTTFIYPNLKSFRVVSCESSFYDFIKKFKTLSSTSANKTKESFKYEYAKEYADVEVINKIGFFETNASKIYKLSKSRLKKIR
ncbi:Sua5 YciO YrdC YwlC family protein [Arcobacter sp. AHV-9/2010]|uniref:Sua5 YciO YrdC YwlC family protein n=1 Tax=Arcobacter sp. AHV-9/2010 TaxID=2021861 RepID=UPI00100B50A9|nr:Sua5 YciO YrdC YwlC family protein [Arcobacter sp. CECT 9299]RXJ95033.1 Sua5 YciO YrdC YwlC family protein [Arcobacter sp. CECT 9299]